MCKISTQGTVLCSAATPRRSTSWLVSVRRVIGCTTTKILKLIRLDRAESNVFEVQIW